MSNASDMFAAGGKITNRPEVGKRYRISLYRDGIFDREEGEFLIVDVFRTYFVAERHGVRITAAYEGYSPNSRNIWMRSFEEI